MNKSYLLLACFLLHGLYASAQILQVGVGKSLVYNQVAHTTVYSEGAFRNTGTPMANHFSILVKKNLKLGFFLIGGAEADVSSYNYETTGVPDPIFNDTKFTFSHRYMTVGIPIGIGKKFSLLKKPLAISAGVGGGFYFNRKQETSSEIDLVNPNAEQVGWASDINVDGFLKANASLWLRAQYKVLYYSCEHDRGGVWLEVAAKQHLNYNTDVSSYAAYNFPERKQQIFEMNNFKNRPFFLSFSVLFDLK